jgi:hypothetical protein
MTRLNDALGATANRGAYPQIGDRARVVRQLTALRKDGR